MIRSVWVVLAGTWLTFYYSGRVVLACWLRRPGVRALCDRVAATWGRKLVGLSGSRVVLHGVDRVDWSRPWVIVANHQSWFDVFAVVGHLPIHARFVAKEELARVPIFGTAWTACGHVAVNRGDRGQAIQSLDAAGKRVQDEALAMVFFPEGTRSDDGRLQRFKKGAFVLAIQTGIPVLPVGISGSRDVMAKGSFRIRRGEIRLRIGEPIPTTGLETEDRDELVHRSREAVLELMEDGDGVGPDTGPAPENTTPEKGRGNA